MFIEIFRGLQLSSVWKLFIAQEHKRLEYFSNQTKGGSKEQSWAPLFWSEKVGICDDFCVLKARSKLYGGWLMC